MVWLDNGSNEDILAEIKSNFEKIHSDYKHNCTLLETAAEGGYYDGKIQESTQEVTKNHKTFVGYVNEIFDKSKEQLLIRERYLQGKEVPITNERLKTSIEFLNRNRAKTLEELDGLLEEFSGESGENSYYHVIRGWLALENDVKANFGDVSRPLLEVQKGHKRIISLEVDSAIVKLKPGSIEQYILNIEREGIESINEIKGENKKNNRLEMNVMGKYFQSVSKYLYYRKIGSGSCPINERLKYDNAVQQLKIAHEQVLEKIQRNCGDSQFNDKEEAKSFMLKYAEGVITIFKTQCGIDERVSLDDRTKEANENRPKQTPKREKGKESKEKVK